jgi:hypothetical protein
MESFRIPLLIIGVIVAALFYRLKSSKENFEEEIAPRPSIVQATPTEPKAVERPVNRATPPPQIAGATQAEPAPIENYDDSPEVKALRARVSVVTAKEIFRTIGVTLSLPMPFEFEWTTGDQKKAVIGLTGRATDGTRLAVASAKTKNLTEMRSYAAELFDVPTTGWKTVTARPIQNCRGCYFYELALGGQKGMVVLGTNALSDVAYCIGLMKPTNELRPQDWQSFVQSIQITRPENY